MWANAQRDGRPAEYTQWATKRNQLIFICIFVKNQRILIQYSQLDLTMNEAREAVKLYFETTVEWEQWAVADSDSE